MFRCMKCGREYGTLPAACACGNADPDWFREFASRQEKEAPRTSPFEDLPPTEPLYRGPEAPQPPQYGQTPPQYAQPHPPQYGQAPSPQYGQAQPPQYGQAQPPYAAPPAPARPKPKKKAFIIVGGILGVLAVLTAGFFIPKALDDNGPISIGLFDTLSGESGGGGRTTNDNPDSRGPETAVLNYYKAHAQRSYELYESNTSEASFDMLGFGRDSVESYFNDRCSVFEEIYGKNLTVEIRVNSKNEIDLDDVRFVDMGRVDTEEYGITKAVEIDADVILSNGKKIDVNTLVVYENGRWKVLFDLFRC